MEQERKIAELERKLYETRSQAPAQPVRVDNSSEINSRIESFKSEIESKVAKMLNENDQATTETIRNLTTAMNTFIQTMQAKLPEANRTREEIKNKVEAANKEIESVKRKLPALEKEIRQLQKTNSSFTMPSAPSTMSFNAGDLDEFRQLKNDVQERLKLHAVSLFFYSSLN